MLRIFFKPTLSPIFLSPEGAETFEDLIARANQVIEEISNKHSSGSVLLVTHGDFGKMLYVAFYKLDWKDVLRQFHFGNSEVCFCRKSPRQKNQYNH